MLSDSTCWNLIDLQCANEQECNSTVVIVGIAVVKWLVHAGGQG